MPGRFSQPYRGQPRPKYPKPKRQFRDLKFEKRLRVFVLGVCILITVVLFKVMLTIYRAHQDGEILATMIVLILLFLLITSAVADSLRSINRFRKGYDIDISAGVEKEDDEQSKDADNL